MSEVTFTRLIMAEGQRRYDLAVEAARRGDMVGFRVQQLAHGCCLAVASRALILVNNGPGDPQP